MSVLNGLPRLAAPIVDRFLPQLARVYRTLRDNRDVRREPAMTPLGFRFVGTEGMEAGTFEPAERALVSRCLSATDVFINIGANVGYYVCTALHSGKHTIAFEPIESNLRYLYRNICANGWQRNVEIFPVALSDYSGVTEMFGGGVMASLVRGWADTPEHYGRLVPVSTLDTLLDRRLAHKRCLFLIDVEGAESAVLRGAVQHLEMHPRPLWIVEICIAEHQPRGTIVNPHLLETFDLFWSRGYRAWTVGETREVLRAEIVALMAGGVDSLGTHNFLFTHGADAPP
jgi:FkbM family methyltransferase